jgi:hypothetical protein
MMKINRKILSIPPYISTSWEQVLALKTERQTQDLLELQISLKDGSTIKIPEMTDLVVEAIFSSHAKHLENPTTENKAQKENSFFMKEPPSTTLILEGPFPFSPGLLENPFLLGGGSMENLKNFMPVFQHDPEKSQEEILFPQSLIDKIVKVMKTLGVDKLNSLPKPEPHCNCPFCQISRSLRNSLEKDSTEVEEEIQESDLSFRSWIIQPTSKSTYTVTHPDALHESYTVDLGSESSPLSCSCGCNRCEHIRAVLSS